MAGHNEARPFCSNISREKLMVEKNTFDREYMAIRAAIHRMNEYWHECRTLFQETSVDERQIMTEVGSHFWGSVREGLQEVLITYINKLTDPVVSAGNENLTLGRILWSARTHLERNSYRDLLETYREIKQNTGPFREWRNKWYQHIDYDLALNGRVSHPMPSIPGQVLIKMIELINLFMTNVGKGTENPVDFTSEIYFGDGLQVLDALRSLKSNPI